MVGAALTRRQVLRSLVATLLPATLAACGTASAPLAAIPTLTMAPSPVPRPTPTVTPAPTTEPPLPTSTSIPAIPTDAEGFADPAFRRLWKSSDLDVASGRVSRTWLWGPQPFAVRREPYAAAPGGSRLVQYFDKSRMEINDPRANQRDQWFVTNGLLTSEMVAGRIQVGPTEFEPLEPAQVPVTGDLESPDPTTPRYADFAGIAATMGGKRAAARLGAPVKEQFSRGGTIGTVDRPPSAVKIGGYDDTLGRNIADVFVTYFQTLAAMDLSWVFVTGYPLTEPYWVSARLGGRADVLLVQLFERRALTYNPRNKEGWQIEFANIGLHYYRWRYHNR